MDILKKIIKSVYEVEGRKKLRRREMELILQYKLQWFDPQTSKKVIDAAIQGSLIKGEGEYFTPAEEVLDTQVEPDFTPPEDFNPEEVRVNLHERIIDHIAVGASISKKDIVARANKYKEMWKVTTETALIIIGYDLGVDMSRFIDAAYSRIMTKTL